MTRKGWPHPSSMACCSAPAMRSSGSIRPPTASPPPPRFCACSIRCATATPFPPRPACSRMLPRRCAAWPPARRWTWCSSRSIAAIDNRRVHRPHPRLRGHDGLADAGIAHVTRQHRIAPPQRPTRRDTVNQHRHLLAGEHLPGPCAVAGVIGKLHGIDRPNLGPQPLQRKHRRRIAHMAVRNP